MSKLITLKPEFRERPVAEQIDYLHKGWSSSNDALELMQNERNGLLDKVTFLEGMLEAAQNRNDIMKSTLEKITTENNARMQRDGEDITKLRAELRGLREA